MSCNPVVSRALQWCLLACLLALPAHSMADAYRFTAGRVVAVSDIHGALDEFHTVLRGTGLVDESLNWAGGRTHLVVTGDLIDRGDHGRQVMDLLMRLTGEAAAAGGAVHVLLGNHEAMNLTADLRYVSVGDYAQFGSEPVNDLPAGFLERRAAFAPDGVYGRWLLGLPVAVVIDETLFVHGGVSERLRGLTLEEINASTQRDLRRFAEGWHALLEAGELGDGDDFDVVRARARELAGRGDERLQRIGEEITASLDGLPFMSEGPLWYRGTARCHPYVEAEPLDSRLRELGARRVVIGHTPTHDRRINSRKDGRVFLIDAGMNAEAYQGRAGALIIEGETVRAWYAVDGETEIEAEPNRVWNRPYGMSDAEIEDFLRTAEITGMEALAGSNDRRRLATLEGDGRQLRAVFNARDTVPGMQDDRWKTHYNQADRYMHEVAAYRLDRLLALEMVPVTVERQIGGESGGLRLWVEPGFTENERQQRQIPFTGDCDLQAEYGLMGIFDLLILNPGPQLGLLRYDHQWRPWLMDQSRAFGTVPYVEALLRRAGLRPSPQLADALGRLTPEQAEGLSEYLHDRQIQALIDRASRLRSRR
jgi:hypothetical protein